MTRELTEQLYPFNNVRTKTERNDALRPPLPQRKHIESAFNSITTWSCTCDGLYKLGLNVDKIPNRQIVGRIEEHSTFVDLGT